MPVGDEESGLLQVVTAQPHGNGVSTTDTGNPGQEHRASGSRSSTKVCQREGGQVSDCCGWDQDTHIDTGSYSSVCFCSARISSCIFLGRVCAQNWRLWAFRARPTAGCVLSCRYCSSWSKTGQCGRSLPFGFLQMRGQKWGW